VKLRDLEAHLCAHSCEPLCEGGENHTADDRGDPRPPDQRGARPRRNARRRARLRGPAQAKLSAFPGTTSASGRSWSSGRSRSASSSPRRPASSVPTPTCSTSTTPTGTPLRRTWSAPPAPQRVSGRCPFCIRLPPPPPRTPYKTPANPLWAIQDSNLGPLPYQRGFVVASRRVQSRIFLQID
jgi:hypothetical protein